MTLFRKTFAARLPDFRSVVPVFAVVSLVLYGWTFIAIFWKLNSWRMNLTVWDIFSVISYSMVKTFLETVLIVALVLVLGFVLPPKIWKEKFVVRGSLTGLSVLLFAILHIKLRAADIQAGILQSMGQWWLLALVLTAALVGLLPIFQIVEKIIFEIADRAVVFLYIFLPLTVVGFFVLVLRSLFAG